MHAEIRKWKRLAANMIFQAEEIDVPVNWDSLLNCLEQMKKVSSFQALFVEGYFPFGSVPSGGEGKCLFE